MALQTKKDATTRLGKMIRYYIAIEQTELRSVAKGIGISAPTLMRISHGRNTDADTFLKVLQWMMETVK